MAFIIQLIKIHKYTFKISSTEGTCTLEVFVSAHKTAYDIFKIFFFCQQARFFLACMLQLLIKCQFASFFCTSGAHDNIYYEKCEIKRHAGVRGEALGCEI